MTYTRRGPGQSYLRTILAERINSLIELKDLDLEINPSKVYENLVAQGEARTGRHDPSMPRNVTPDEAAAHPKVQEIIGPRAQMLHELGNSFVDTMIRGLDEIPYGIRWICKQIRSLSRRKYPDAQDHMITSLIGGFFFLRFINPAIISPQSYMLIDSAPADCPKVTLKYIAKMLQNLANKPSYAKETYMQRLEPFVQENRNRVSKFLLDVCEVQDFYESLEMDNYVALSKKDLELGITLNEVYAMHQMLLDHAVELVHHPYFHLAFPPVL